MERDRSPLFIVSSSWFVSWRNTGQAVLPILAFIRGVKYTHLVVQVLRPLALGKIIIRRNGTPIEHLQLGRLFPLQYSPRPEGQVILHTEIRYNPFQLLTSLLVSFMK
jgi:hypothetical protein